VSAIAALGYLVHDPQESPNGGTALGYVLGVAGVGLILWLIYFGMRKRSYASRLGTVEGWLSAHVYLGMALVVVVTLHTGFQWGANVHTLAYVLMLLVVSSGLFGVYAYFKYPALLSDNRAGVSREVLLGEVGALDRRLRQIASELPAHFAELISSAISRTVLGGSVWSQLSGRDRSRVVIPRGGDHVVVRNADQNAALDWLSEQQSRNTDADVAAKLAELSTLLRNKGRVLQQLRRDVRMQALLGAWLYVHVPLSFALLAALIAHVTTVFLYW